MFKVNIGDLDKRITIQKSIVTQDKSGFEVEEWKDYKKVYASINGLFGKEYFAAAATQTESTLDFLIRYSKDLEMLFEKGGTVGYRIVWSNRNYNITYVDNIKYKNKLIKLKAIVSRND